MFLARRSQRCVPGSDSSNRGAKRREPRMHNPIDRARPRDACSYFLNSCRNLRTLADLRYCPASLHA